jgi:hypothetical protein
MVYFILLLLAVVFLSNFGAYSLFLAPEYYNDVSFISTAIVGFFCWCIYYEFGISPHLFFLEKHIQFLATNCSAFFKVLY